MNINTNIQSLNAVRLLSTTEKQMATSMERLTSGLRINSAADDAAGLAVTVGMTSQSRGLDMAIRNAQDGFSLLQTLDGATEEVVNQLQRVRELSIQALNGTYSDNNRKQMDVEVQQIKLEIERVATTTKFNGNHLMANVKDDGTISVGRFGVRIHAGWEAGEPNKLSVELANFSFTGLRHVFPDEGDIFHAYLSNNQYAESDFVTLNIDSLPDASAALVRVDAALSNIGVVRSKWGALQNRLESTISNLSNVNNNIQASRSQILDTDFAKESADLAKTQLLQQTGMSMLAQANQSSQNVMILLNG